MIRIKLLRGYKQYTASYCYYYFISIIRKVLEEI